MAQVTQMLVHVRVSKSGKSILLHLPSFLEAAIPRFRGYPKTT